MRDWNYADTAMHWPTAQTWAAGLTVGSFSGWRLPFVVDTGTPGCDWSYAGGTDCGYNVQTKSGSTVYSEMAYMWYAELGNLAYCPSGDSTCAGGPQPGWGLTNTGDFKNLQSFDYWSGTEYAPNPGSAWLFNTGYGYQGDNVKVGGVHAVAVRPGDVAAVPEPATLPLVGAALLGVAATRRRKPTIE